MLAAEGIFQCHRNHKVSHKEAVNLRDIAIHSEQLFEVIELSMDVVTYCVTGEYTLHVALLYQDLSRLEHRALTSLSLMGLQCTTAAAESAGLGW